VTLRDTAPGAPIGGCDPPHSASNAAAAMLTAYRRFGTNISAALGRLYTNGYAKGIDGIV
jgi:hypothetical protein